MIKNKKQNKTEEGEEGEEEAEEEEGEEEERGGVWTPMRPKAIILYPPGPRFILNFKMPFHK
jgi:hypothetical protein